VGVPVIAPVLLFSVNPGGRPLGINQVYGVVPPLAVRVAEYDTFCVPLDSDAVAMVSDAACTVSPALPETPLSVAMMVVLPGFTAVASPAPVIVATLVFDEVHVTELVMFWVLPLEYVPVAVNCCVAPTWIV
jgi:hypothetical protein